MTNRLSHRRSLLGWSLVSGSPFSSPVRNTGNDAFGGNGVPGGSCVKTGPFRQGVWSLQASAGGGCLARNFFSTPPDAIAVHDMISSNSNLADFFNFEVALRREFHDEVHCIIDSTMCTLDSATAPGFFLHLGFVDKIWCDWQKLSPHTNSTHILSAKLSACRAHRTDPKPFLT